MKLDDDLIIATKVAFGLRLARASLGMSQADFGALLGVSKPTIVRLETMGSPIKLAFYSKMVKTLSEMGVCVDAVSHEGVKIEVDESAVMRLIKQVEDEKVLRKKRFN
jgi:DNA-binding XRE family transcriptional regulator